MVKARLLCRYSVFLGHIYSYLVYIFISQLLEKELNDLGLSLSDVLLTLLDEAVKAILHLDFCAAFDLEAYLVPFAA